MSFEPLELTIQDLSRAGSGVGRDESGRAVFVPLTAPGDRVRVRIVREEKRYAEAELLEILEASPERVVAPCPVFGKCGGCQWQHLKYSLQWQTKAAGVRHALERVGVDPSGFAWDELPAERIWEYRNRIQLRGEGQAIGFYAPGTHEIVPIVRCEIARPEINARIPALATEGSRLPRPYKVEVEVLPDGKLRESWNARHAAGGFRQVHDEQNAKLQGWVAAQLTPGKNRRLLDLFGGSANLSLGLADRYASIDCVDLGAPSGPPAGSPPHLRFHRSEVTKWLARAVRESGPASAILDPPRIGLGSESAEISDCLKRLGVSELLAVGCDADSWARDVSRLVRYGWKLERAAVLDLFPQTPHVESLAVFRR